MVCGVCGNRLSLKKNTKLDNQRYVNGLYCTWWVLRWVSWSLWETRFLQSRWIWHMRWWLQTSLFLGTRQRWRSRRLRTRWEKTPCRLECASTSILSVPDKHNKVLGTNNTTTATSITNLLRREWRYRSGWQGFLTWWSGWRNSPPLCSRT